MAGRRAGWKRLLVVWVKIMLYCGLMLSPAMRWQVPAVKANPGTTVVFSALAYDGYLQNSSSAWADAWAGVSGTVYNDTTGIVVGDWIFFGTHYLRRGYLIFDTSSLPDNAAIKSWWISINVTTISGTGFNLTVVNGQPTYPHIPLDSYDFNKDYYSVSTTSNCTVSVDTLTQNVYNNFTASTEAGWISLTGYTKLCVRADFDINNQDPGAGKYVTFRAYETDADDPYSPAKLYVTYITGPQPSNIGYTKRYLAEETTFHVYWSGTNLSGYIFGWNATGAWQNDTYVSFSGSPNNAWSNITKELPPKRGITIVWRVWCNDTNGWGDTGEQTLITIVRDYSIEQTRLINDYSPYNWSQPEYWLNVAENLQFKGVDEWVNQSVTLAYGRFIKLDNITSEGAGVRGIEINIRADGTWISPSDIFDYCGYYSTYYPENFIDGNLSTYWYDQNSEGHIHFIILDIGTYKEISGISIYVDGAATSNWTNVDVAVALGSFFTTGNSPYLDAVDYPSNYIYTNKSNAITGNFTFQPTSYATIVDNVTLWLNYSSTGKEIKIWYWDGSWKEVSEILTSTGGTWEVKNVTLIRNYWSPTIFNSLKIMLRSGNSSGEVKIDFANVRIRVYNMTRMLEWLFDTMYARIHNSNIPMVRDYDEDLQQWKNTTNHDLLSGALLYKLTDNQTFLTKATEYADWLDNLPPCRALQRYNLTTGTWIEPLKASYGASVIFRLCVLTGLNSTFKDYLGKVVENYTDIFLSTNYEVYRSVYVNGTVSDSTLFADVQAKAMSAIAYAGYLLDNETLLNTATQMAMKWYVDPDTGIPRGSAPGGGTKSDQHYGHFLLGLENVYYFTSNSSVKDRIKTVAEASQYFWNETYDYWYYRVLYDTGEPAGSADMIAVHGFGYVDEALIGAYLIWGNDTWLEWVKKDFNSMVVKDGIIKNDLILHGVTYPLWAGGGIQNPESNDYWNAHAKRVALILYDLNTTGNYRNSTYVYSFSRLYGSTSVNHQGNLGWIQSISYTDFSPILENDVALSTIFRNFMNITDVTINTFTELYASFGNPFTGEVLINPVPTNIGTNTTTPGTTCNFHTLWTDMDGLDTALFYWNASGTMQPNGTIQLTGTEVWSNFTRALPNQGGITIAWYIVANDTLGNWGNTTTQYLTLAQFITKVFQEDIGASDCANSHGTVLVSEAVVSFDGVTKFIGKLQVEAVTFAVTVSKHAGILLRSSLHFLSSAFKIPSILHLETVGLQSHAGKSAALTIKEAIILPDIPFKGIVKHFQEALAFTDQPYTSIFLLFQERVTEQLTIGDRAFKVVTVVNREALFPADFISKQIGKTFVSAATLLDSATTQIIITLQEQIIPEHLWLQDSATKLIVLFKTENLNLQETLTKHIQILKEEALSLLDTITKQIGPFIYERLRTETVELKDKVLVVAYTPWYNNPATFIQVCLYAFCIGLFAYYIYKQL